MPHLLFCFDITYYDILGVSLIPFFEELCNRAIILAYLKKHYNTFISLLMSSFIFALGHDNLEHALAIFTFSMIIGYVFIKSNSLVLATLMHAYYNILPTLTSYGLHKMTEMRFLYAITWLVPIALFLFVLKQLVKQINHDVAKRKQSISLTLPEQ